MKTSTKTTLVMGVLASSLLFSTSVLASGTTQKAIDEKYTNADYMLGYSLNDTQKDEVLKILDFGTNDKFELITPEGYNEVLGSTSDGDMSLYSSVKIEKLDDSKPLEVVIETGDPNVKKEDRITRVTEDMYRNAALTSGIEHAKITVTTAPDLSVTGESALAGVYLSMKNKGIEVDPQSVELSNAEINMLSQIKELNKDNDDYNDDKLNAALLDIKKEVSDLSEKQLTEEKVKSIVEDALKKYQLNDVIQTPQVNNIINYSLDFGNLTQGMSKEDRASLVDSITSVKTDLVGNAKDSLKGIDIDGALGDVKEKSAGFFKSIGNWFANLWNSIFGSKDTEVEEEETVVEESSTQQSSDSQATSNTENSTETSVSSSN